MFKKIIFLFFFFPLVAQADPWLGFNQREFPLPFFHELLNYNSWLTSYNGVLIRLNGTAKKIVCHYENLGSAILIVDRSRLGPQITVHLSGNKTVIFTPEKPLAANEYQITEDARITIQEEDSTPRDWKSYATCFYYD